MPVKISVPVGRLSLYSVPLYTTVSPGHSSKRTAPIGSGISSTRTLTKLSQPLAASPGKRSCPVGRDSEYEVPL